MIDLAPPLIIAPRGTLPVMLSVPHSGRDYPDWLVDSSRGGIEPLRALEDPLVDRLVWRALQLGLGAVIARAPRAAVDCNRGEDEIDPALIACNRPVGAISARTRGGLGIVPSRTAGHGRLWRDSISKADLDARIVAAHRPYHSAIAAQLQALVERHGCGLLLDCHSMPPAAGGAGPMLVVGDLHGRSADRWLAQDALAIARRTGFSGQLNAPFAGGAIVERHGAPRRGIHALQIEFDRLVYLDATMRRPGPGFDRAASLLEGLATELGEALAGRHLATAAE